MTTATTGTVIILSVRDLERLHDKADNNRP